MAEGAGCWTRAAVRFGGAAIPHPKCSSPSPMPALCRGAHQEGSTRPLFDTVYGKGNYN